MATYAWTFSRRTRPPSRPPLPSPNPHRHISLSSFMNGVALPSCGLATLASDCSTPASVCSPRRTYLAGEVVCGLQCPHDPALNPEFAGRCIRSSCLSSTHPATRPFVSASASTNVLGRVRRSQSRQPVERACCCDMAQRARCGCFYICCSLTARGAVRSQ